jgi:transitional endoplasmic reticulum ATPase
VNKDFQILEKGSIVDENYSIQFYIDADKYAQNYRAKDKSGKIVGLKVYNAAKLNQRFFTDQGDLLELKLLRELNHTGIIKLTDEGNFIKGQKKYKYLVSEFISGESLRNKFKREGRFSPYTAIPIIIELLNTVQYLHNLKDPIIHNSISMDNIDLDYSQNQEKPVLTNFLNALYFASSTDNFSFDGLSPFYVAPEVFNKVITPQSDLFSIGALLYHLILGVPPWYFEMPEFQFTDSKLYKRISEERNKQLNFTLADESIDDHLRNTIKKALAIDVDERFSSSEEFKKALKRELAIENLSDKRTKQRKIVKKESEKGNGFSQIAGMEELKDLLYNDVIRALSEKELYDSYGITIPNGMLLYGPPGCGKTFVSEKFAEEVGFNFLKINPSDIKSKYVNATEEKIGDLFREAETNAPTVIFFDEIDAIVPNRESELHHMHASTVNELLAQMNNCAEKGIFIIAATNRPEKIDTAILRTGRIDRMIYLPPPDTEARKGLFKLYLKDRPIDLAVDFDKLAQLTGNYVSSDIKFLIDEASRKALKSKSRITQQILEEIISSTPPSVSATELAKYEQAKRELEGKRKGDKENPRPRIGFNVNPEND